jgi:hypothetical protein
MTEFGATDDLKEYFISTDPNNCALHTIELRHPAFVDESGNHTVLRVVCDHEDLDAVLEADAPENGGEAVTFTALAFEAKLPDQGSDGSPDAQLDIDNVSAILMPYLEAAANSQYKVGLTYRMFLASDLTKPGLIMDGLTPNSANATETHASVKAGYETFYNTPFPPKTYTALEYPGLDR